MAGKVPRRYVSLTQGAWQYLREYEWPGNLDQLYSICERLVLLTQKRNIDETFLREQLEQMVPRLLPGTSRSCSIRTAGQSSWQP